MEVIIEHLFKEQFKKCPIAFQLEFRKIYQQLRVVDNPLEVKNVVANRHSHNYYKLRICKSRIGMSVQSGKLHIANFLYNQYFENDSNF